MTISLSAFSKCTSTMLQADKHWTESQGEQAAGLIKSTQPSDCRSVMSAAGVVMSPARLGFWKDLQDAHRSTFSRDPAG